MYLHNFEDSEDAEFRIRLDRPYYLLKLPNIPKNIEEMLIIRSGLKQLFKSTFKEGRFYCTIINPEIINLLFDNDKTISPQFNIQEPCVFFKNNCDNFLKFTLNHLSKSTYLFLNVCNLEEYTAILFNILKNEGNKFHLVSITCSELARMHDLIIEVNYLIYVKHIAI